jgi:hypothetical protein
MPAYRVTVTPHSSLFLARERGNRAIRRSFPYIPASTASGALNSYFHQIGWKELMHTFRFSNLYPIRDSEKVWLPSPRTLYRCPLCSQVAWMQDFDPVGMVGEVMCPNCGAMRRAAKGFVAAHLTHDAVYPDGLVWERVPALNAQLSGRVVLHRTTGGQMDGRLHFVEVLRARNLPFRGLAWVKQSAAGTLRAGESFRLTMGGLRSRGSGRVTLTLDAVTVAATPVQEHDLLLVETPLLPLPTSLSGTTPALTVKAVSPYARVAVCERWAVKPLPSGKGLVSFLDTLTVGSVLQVVSGTTVLWPGLFFYRMAGTDMELYSPPLLDDPVLGEDPKDYTTADLWTLGFGQLRHLGGPNVA